MQAQKHIAIVINETLETALAAAQEVIDEYSDEDHYFSAILPEHAEPLEIGVFDGRHTELDLILSLGGDGTILRTAKLIDYAATPILGINLGRLGFLSGATHTDMHEAIRAALKNETVIETRNLVRVRGLGEDVFTDYGLALNEVVIGRGFGEPTVTTELEINNHKIYTSSGDGIIVATATGSTAYALSAGGPIMSPDYDGLVIVTLASHTLVQRAIVTGNKDLVAINFPDKRRANIEMVLDGEQIEVSRNLDSIHCHVSEKAVHLVKLGYRRFYDTVAGEFFS